MKILSSILLFLLVYPSLDSETVLMHGTLSHCQKDETATSLVLRAVTYESQSNSEEIRLQQALARLYRQNGALQVHISQEEILRHIPCPDKNNPFSLAFPALNTLKIKTEVDPETLKISFKHWLEEPSLLKKTSLLAFETPQHFVPDYTSEMPQMAVSEALSHKAEPNAYPPGGTGYGSVTFENGDSYTGYFKNYRFDGKGIYRWKNGNTHDGYFSSGQRHGAGTWIRVGLGRWIGNWVRDSLEGFGRIYYNNGQTYEGDFLNWLAHGYGKWTWPNGQYYEGSFLYDHFSGLGTMVLANGTKYVGNWVQSRRNGYGVSTYASGDVYAGSWANDRYHGQGKYTGRDWWYEGSWVEDQRDGLGTQENERTRYEGLWERDQMHGKGVLTDKKEGTTWETVWFRGDLLREYTGVITVRDGHRFEGVFKGLLPHLGKVVFSNQDTYEGPFVNGKFHGRGKYTFFQEGIVIEDEFKEDSCLLSLEDSLARLNISMNEDNSPPPAASLKDELFPEITVAFSAEEDSGNEGKAAVAVVLVPFLKEVAVATTVGYMRVSRPLRFLTYTKPFAAQVAKYRTGPGTGIIYYREDEEKYEPELFLYVGKTINEGNYLCRQRVHNKTYKKLHSQHELFRFTEFETHLNIFDPIFKLKEQAYIQQCETATHPLCAPHGPSHLANKINSMGMKGFDEWKAANFAEWLAIESSCGLLP